MGNTATPPAQRAASFLRLRGKSFMSVVLTPDLPLDAWIAQLDEQIARSPKVFEGRPVLLDVSLLAGHEAHIVGLVRDLGARGVRVIGIDGSMPHALGPYAAELPAIMSGGRNAQITGGDTVKVNAISGAGEDTVATLLINSGTLLTAESVHTVQPEPENTELEQYLRGRIAEYTEMPGGYPDMHDAEES